MAKPPRLEEIFSPEPERVNITGFSYPSSPVLMDLEKTLGMEPILKAPRRRKERSVPVRLGFNPDFIEQRQQFFRRMEGTENHPIRSHFLEAGLEEMDREYIARRTKKGFLNMCDRVYRILEESRVELEPFATFAEARRVIRRVHRFDSDLREMLSTLRSIQELERFAIDTGTGTFAPLEQMPKPQIEYNPSYERRDIPIGHLISDIRFGLKKSALRLAKEIGMSFKERIREFARNELRVRPGEDNLRRAYEYLALPIRLGLNYRKFLDPLLNSSHKEEDMDLEGDIDFFDEDPIDEEDDFHHSLDSIPGLVYPEFGQHYDIRGLFPPKVMSRWGIDREVVPINFRTRRGEKKFLISGLHSGGKSFFVDNLILVSVLGQTGLDLLGDKVVLPVYNNIFYYRNPDNSSRGLGKLEKEVQEMLRTVRMAEKGDLLIVDEFLDSANHEVATSLGENLLDRLGESRTTIIVITHKETNYARHARRGWTMLSPAYSVVDGKIKLERALRRGSPRRGINKRYIIEQYPSFF